MKQLTHLWMYLVVLIMTLSSCEAIEGIFKAGFYSAFILIFLVVILIIWLVSRGRR